MTSIKSLTRSSTLILSMATICFAVSAQVSAANDLPDKTPTVVVNNN